MELGFSAQAIKETFLAKGFNSNISVYTEEVLFIDADGNVTSTDTGTTETYWGVKYEYLIAPLVAAVKELKAEIDALKNG